MVFFFLHGWKISMKKNANGIFFFLRCSQFYEIEALLSKYADELFFFIFFYYTILYFTLLYFTLLYSIFNTTYSVLLQGSEASINRILHLIKYKSVSLSTVEVNKVYDVNTNTKTCASLFPSLSYYNSFLFYVKISIRCVVFDSTPIFRRALIRFFLIPNSIS